MDRRKELKIRPDKPGPWLIEAKGESTPWCVQISPDMRVLLPGFSMPYRIEEFENRVVWFVKWLGPAHPPKKVGYSVGMLPMDLQIKPHERGPLVLYDAVKEYLLNGDENEE
jgi:hypothetical protein